MRTSAALEDMRIVAVDDDPVILRMVARRLRNAGFAEVHEVADPLRAQEVCLAVGADLVITDLHMPGMDGIELIGRLRRQMPDVPILLLTGDESPEVKRRAFECGARDFLTKTAGEVELYLRVANLLEVRTLERRLRQQNQALEQRVRERTAELDTARLEMLERLALAAEYRDDDTQQHAMRIGRTAALLASRLGWEPSDVDDLRRAAALHDIGKIAIPDAVLLKPGRLDPAEWSVMQSHTTAGAAILGGSGSRLLRMAEEIAVSHHERWEGTGYPKGLAGRDIPASGRLVAVADVFDALVHSRPYKVAWPVERASEEILAQRGRQFDPDVVDAFAVLDHAGLLEPLGAGAPATAEPRHRGLR